MKNGSEKIEILHDRTNMFGGGWGVSVGVLWVCASIRPQEGAPVIRPCASIGGRLDGGAWAPTSGRAWRGLRRRGLVCQLPLEAPGPTAPGLRRRRVQQMLVAGVEGLMRKEIEELSKKV